ncbi:MAG: hypothetical protein JWM95_1501 [Gemmatimonadetes bacterium]|nr:hypothetical protein [Gemmatimonadota bacterium]
MGRFIARSLAYQRVAPRLGEPYVRYVDARGPWRYSAPLVVLVGRWTGSMAEGIAIGLDGMQRGSVVGTAMAGLAGAVEDVTLGCSRFVVGYPAARLLSSTERRESATSLASWLLRHRRSATLPLRRRSSCFALVASSRSSISLHGIRDQRSPLRQ